MSNAEYLILCTTACFFLVLSAIYLVAAVRREDTNKQDIAMFILTIVVFGAITWDWFLH